MTSEEFRKDSDLRAELSKLMYGNAALQQALAIVKSKNELALLPLGMNGIDHARALAERQTRALIVAELFEMTTALPDGPEDRPAETFGTEHTVDDFDQPEKTE